MAQSNVLSLDDNVRRIYTTADSWDACLVDAYFNPFKRELEVGEIIEIRNYQGRKQIIVIGLDPYVTVASYRDDSVIQDVLSGTTPPPTPTTGSATFSISTNPNSLVFAVGINVDFNATRYRIQRDSYTASTSTSDGIAASWTGTRYFFVSAPAYSTDYDYYAEAYDSDAGAWVQATDGQGNTSITVRAVANDKPSPLTIALVSGSETDTGAQVTVSTPSTVDDTAGDNITLDITYGANNTVLASDVTPGSTVTLSSLTAGTPYQNVRLRGTVTGDPDGSRTGYSAPISFTTTSTSTPSITSATVPDTTSTSCSVTALSVTGSYDEIILWVGQDTTARDPNDANWSTSISAPIAFTAPGNGTFQLNMQVRDSADPSNLSNVYSVSFTVTVAASSTAIVSLDSDIYNVIEFLQPNGAFGANRSVNTGGLAFVSTVDYTLTPYTGQGVPAVDANSDPTNGNCWMINGTLSFPSDETNVDIPMQVLDQSLSEVDPSNDVRQVLLTLVPGTETNCDLGGITSAVINIRGTGGILTGYVASGNTVADVDIRAFEKAKTYLTARTGQQTASGTGAINYAHNYIDGQGIATNCFYKNGHSGGVLGINNLLAENAYNDIVVLENHTGGATIRNSRVRRARNAGSGWGTGIRVVRGVPASGTNDIKVLNCLEEECTVGVHLYGLNAISGFEHSWSCRRQPDSSLISAAAVGWGASLQAFAYCAGMVAPKMQGNTVKCPTAWNGANGGIDFTDFINTYQSGCDSANPAQILTQHIHGNLRVGGGSANGMIFGDGGGTKGYFQGLYNTIVNAGNTCLAMTGGIGEVFKYSDVFMHTPTRSAGGTGAGVGVGRVVGVSPGQLYNGTTQHLRVLWYQDDGAGGFVKAIKRHVSPSYLDGLNPNHGPGPVGTPSVNPTGFASDIHDMETPWGGKAGVQGYEYFVLCKSLLSQPFLQYGLEYLYASMRCPPGRGRIRWNHTNRTLEFAAFGDSYGDPVDVDTAQALYGVTLLNDPRKMLFSHNVLYSVYVVLHTDSLPASDVVLPCNVGVWEKGKQFVYAGTSGDFSGYDDDTVTTNGTAPTIPANPSAAANSGYNTFSFDQSTDADGTVVGYWIYRMDETAGETSFTYLDSIPDSASPSYDDSAIIDGHTYQYQSKAVDDTGLTSDYSEPVSVTAAATSSYDNPNTEFTATTGLTASAATLSIEGGTFLVITNSGAASGIAYMSWTLGGGTTSLSIDWSMKRDVAGDADVRFVLDSGDGVQYNGDVSGGTWNGNCVLGSSASGNKVVDVTALAGSTIYLSMRCNSSTSGNRGIVDYLRVTES